MTFATSRPQASWPKEGTLTRAALGTTFDDARLLVVFGPLRRSAEVIAGLVAAVAVILCIPFVILAIGIPIALCVRLLLWIVGSIVGML
jgi:hypothetical protein